MENCQQCGEKIPDGVTPWVRDDQILCNRCYQAVDRYTDDHQPTISLITFKGHPKWVALSMGLTLAGIFAAAAIYSVASSKTLPPMQTAARPTPPPVHEPVTVPNHQAIPTPPQAVIPLQKPSGLGWSLSATLVGTGIKEDILIAAMNANPPNLGPQYCHDFRLVSTTNENARLAIYRDQNNSLLSRSNGSTDDLTLTELWMPIERFFGEENGEVTGEGASAFGRCVQRLGFAADPSWSGDLYNWMNQQMARALLTPDGVYTTRREFRSKIRHS